MLNFRMSNTRGQNSVPILVVISVNSARENQLLVVVGSRGDHYFYIIYTPSI